MRVRRLVVGVVISLVALVGVGFLVLALLIASRGHSDVAGVPIINRTDQTLKIYSLIAPGDPDIPDRLLIEEIPPGGTGESSGPCILGSRLIARIPDGTVVARIGPFDECYEGPWIIGAEPES